MTGKTITFSSFFLGGGGLKYRILFHTRAFAVRMNKMRARRNEVLFVILSHSAVTKGRNSGKRLVDKTLKKIGKERVHSNKVRKMLKVEPGERLGSEEK